MKAMKINQVMNTLIACSIAVFSLIGITLSAQNIFKNPILKSNFYIEPNVGLSQYYGDLNGKKLWNQYPRFAFGFVLGYKISPIFGLQGQFLKTNLYSKRPDQNMVFSSRLWDCGLNLTVDINEVLAEYIPDFNEKTLLKFYFYSGAGISSFKSKLNDLESGELLKKHAVVQHKFFLPLGAEAVYKLNNNFSVNLEYGDHTIFGGTNLDFTDKVKKNNDHYSYASVGLQIRIGVKDTDNDGVIDKDDLCPGLYGKAELAGCPDHDNDGIADKDDLCPDVAGGIEFNGCPDKDGDGVIDREDDCPNVAGLKQLHGCPDKDNDGIADIFDKCPDVPGKNEFSGCPDRDGDGVIDQDDKCPDVSGRKELAGCLDSDGDGIIDSQDACPLAAGKKELSGCPDRDGDGIADKDDVCPDIKGLVAFSGCPDTDGDGVPDNKDNCPNVPGVISNNGCPRLIVKEKEPEIAFMKIVYFDPGSTAVIQTYRNTIILDEIAEYMKSHPKSILLATGYEDANEAEYKNFHLSEKRTDYISNYLNKKGISNSRIKKIFLGKKNPVADNGTAEGRTLNRRVELKVTK